MANFGGEAELTSCMCQDCEVRVSFNRAEPYSSLRPANVIGEDALD